MISHNHRNTTVARFSCNCGKNHCFPNIHRHYQMVRNCCFNLRNCRGRTYEGVRRRFSGASLDSRESEGPVPFIVTPLAREPKVRAGPEGLILDEVNEPRTLLSGISIAGISCCRCARLFLMASSENSGSFSTVRFRWAEASALDGNIERRVEALILALGAMVLACFPFVRDRVLLVAGVMTGAKLSASSDFADDSDETLLAE